MLLQIHVPNVLAPFGKGPAMSASAALWSIAENPGTVAFCRAAEVAAAAAAGAPVQSVAQITTGLGHLVIRKTPEPIVTEHPQVSLRHPADPPGKTWVWNLVKRVEPEMWRVPLEASPRAALAAGQVDAVLAKPLPYADWGDNTHREFSMITKLPNLPDLVVATHRDIAGGLPLSKLLLALQATVLYAKRHPRAAGREVAMALGRRETGAFADALVSIANRGSTSDYVTLRHDPAAWKRLPGGNMSGIWTDDLLR
jgi:ABC-type nitrate/sulfonate/bicarbonate transport system substrate-binding protein